MFPCSYPDDHLLLKVLTDLSNFRKRDRILTSHTDVLIESHFKLRLHDK